MIPASPKSFTREGYSVYGQSPIVISEDLHEVCISELAESVPERRKTRIICTMGPSCWDVANLIKLINAGMNVARFNFSHGDHATHQNTVNNLQKAVSQVPGAQVALLLDTKGPEIRTGFFRSEVGSKITLKAGQKLILTTDAKFLGDSSKIACSYPGLADSVKVGSVILVADGSVSLIVLEILDHPTGHKEVVVMVKNDAVIGERKNMNLPGVEVDLPVISEKDKMDIMDFAVPNGFNFIAASFVQTAKDVKDIRELLGCRGRHIKIIPKIENQAGILNFDEILAAADGIMIARGDLGMEIPIEKVFLAQKMMIAKCNLKGKPVITATQMLETMTVNPRPTRAEASDVANAVLDGTDAVMLSGETAGGAFPIEAVTIMSNVCIQAESCVDYRGMYAAIRDGVLIGAPKVKGYAVTSVSETTCSVAVKAAIDTAAKLIICLTETGTSARLLSKYRPEQAIMALSTSDSTIKHLQISRGVLGIKVPSFQGTDAIIEQAIRQAKLAGLCASGDRIVCVHGQQEEVSGMSNLMKVIEVDACEHS